MTRKIENIDQLLVAIERMDSHTASGIQLRSKAIGHKFYGTGDLDQLIAQYEEQVSSLREFRMAIAREKEAQAKANPSTDGRTVYCSGCESAEYQEILSEVRFEGASYREQQAHLAKYVRLIICDSCQQELDGYEYDDLDSPEQFKADWEEFEDRRW